MLSALSCEDPGGRIISETCTCDGRRIVEIVDGGDVASLRGVLPAVPWSVSNHSSAAIALIRAVIARGGHGHD
ncbi:hypothetical protein [Microbacterium sp. EST19A]|uniref:hypothetical protein n=1 Tax=Microbacterium sp. EST19A TaxID=2862681 RepID=UPI001CBFA393|nr:hypothetical protein [Microbacterium sp. EST19A]